MRKLNSASEFHNFEQSPVLVGRFINLVHRDQDAPDGKGKADDLLGFELEKEDGECVIAGASYMIEKTLQKAGMGTVVGIKFLGQTKNSKNQPVNRFEIIEFDGAGTNGNPWAEALAYYGDKLKNAF